MNSISKTFNKIVKEAFSFLVSDYDMQYTVEQDDLYSKVRYVRNPVFLDVFFDMNSFEIGVNTGLVSSLLGEKCSYGLEEVMEAILGNSHEISPFYQSSSEKGIEECIKHIADVIKEYYVPVLKGNKGIFKKIDLASKNISQELTTEIKLKRVREKASEAWQQKDYLETIKLYKKIKPYLTPSEAKRLEYARKQV